MTEQAKHTKGPWKAGKAFVGSSGQTRYNITGEDNGYSRRVIADTPFFEGTGEDVHAANARLIASAPDLLEACKEGIDLIELVLELDDLELDDSGKDQEGNDYRAWFILRDAINKAEGAI